MTQGGAILTLVFREPIAVENLPLNLETGNVSNNTAVGSVPWRSLIPHSKLKRNGTGAACFLDSCQVPCFGSGFVQIHSLKSLPNPEDKQSAALSMTISCFELLLPVLQQSKKAEAFLSNTLECLRVPQNCSFVVVLRPLSYDLCLPLLTLIFWPSPFHHWNVGY